MTTTTADEKRIGDYSQQHLWNHAQTLFKEKEKVTTIFSQEALDKLPKFQSKELELGRVLGRGGFCVVHEIQSITLQNDNDDDDNNSDAVVQNRNFMARYCIRDKIHARYALKQLSKESMQSSDLYVQGLVDLWLECQFLAVIRHAHICKMRGIVNLGKHEPCLVLDRLYETFEEKLKQWNKTAASSMCPCLGTSSSSKQEEVWGERLLMAADLASAFKYLHGINIVYRDLKPDNLRFDVRGDVKLFDFGLARELNPQLLVENDENDSCCCLYRMTGDTGSIVYMAPEVALNQPYNERVDVYSFGILLWQICKGAMTVYEGFNYNVIMSSIVKGGARPAMDQTWSVGLQQLINKCWCRDVSKRPSMEQVLQGLNTEMRNAHVLQEQEGGGGELDVSMKSMHSLHAKKQAGGG